MKNTKTIFKFYTLFEYEEEEAFLENQHKNGWKVVSFKIPGFYKFKNASKKMSPTELISQMKTELRMQNTVRCLQIMAGNSSGL